MPYRVYNEITIKERETPERKEKKKMTRYGIQYRENGLLKNRGFKYEEQYRKALARLQNKANVIICKVVEDFKVI